jgi:zinc D-Ala-D-Ala carboxypeptidase
VAAIDDYAARIAALGRELGLPADYVARRRLPLQPEAAVLVECGRDFHGRGLRLTPEAATAWMQLVAASQADGIALQAVSGFRSVERQAAIIREKRAAGLAVAEILASVAAPGYSEHHSGRAVDVTTPTCESLSEKFGDTPAFQWLTARAGAFGFVLSYPADNPHGLVYEPWHWCWHPPGAARTAGVGRNPT